MERNFDTNLILNDVYDNMDGAIRLRRFDSNYIFNAIYDPDAPGLRVNKLLNFNSTDLDDMPSPLEPGKFLQVNPEGTAYEFVDIENVIEINIVNFTDKYNNSQLIPLQWYLITDYRTFDYIRQSNTPCYEWYLGEIEQIYIQALDINKISPEGWSKDFPDEKIMFQPSRDFFSENPTFTLDQDKVNQGTISIDTPDEITIKVIKNPYRIDPVDGNNFFVSISDGDFYQEYNDANKNIDWKFNENNDFELIKTFYDVPVYRFIDYSGHTSTGSQEISILNPKVFIATTPLNTFNDIYTDNYYYFYIYDIDSGAENAYDYIGRDDTWTINSFGQFELLDLGSYTNEYAYYDSVDGSTGDINVSIDDVNVIAFNRADWKLRKGSEYNGSTYLDITWTDETVLSLNNSNYDVEWAIYGNSIFLLRDSHDLKLDLKYFEGWIAGSDQTKVISLKDDVSIYSDFYSLGYTLDLTNPVYIDGNYIYTVQDSNSGIITNRQIPKNGLDVDVDYRATKFRRYSLLAPAYSNSVTYNPGDIVKYNNESYICLTTSLNKSLGTNIYWIKMTSEENDLNQNKYLGVNGINFNIDNPYDSGLVNSAYLVQGGNGYPVSSTITLRVLAGDCQCTLSALTDSNGFVSSILSILTPGRGYQANNSNYPYFCSSTVEGGGACVYVYTTFQTSTVYVKPDLTDYDDFDIFADLSQLQLKYELKLKKISESPIDLVIKNSYNINSTLKLGGGCVTIGSLINSNATIYNNVAIIKTLQESNIDFMDSSISYMLNGLTSKSVKNSSLYNIQQSKIDFIDSCLTGLANIVKTDGISWVKTIIQGSDSNTLNYLTNSIFVASNFSGNYLNKIEYFVQTINYSITSNNVTGYMKRIWINSFFKSNVITNDCFYISVLGVYFEGNVINSLIGIETTGGNSIYPCVFDVFISNVIRGTMMGVVGKSLSFVGNSINAGFATIRLFREPNFTFNFANNTFLNTFSSMYIYTNNGSFSDNFITGSSGQIIFSFSNTNKQFIKNTVLGRIINLNMINGNVEGNIFYNNIGAGGTNVVNSGFTSAVINNVFYGDVSNNSFTSSLSKCVFNYVCQNNIFDQSIDTSIFEQNFINNSFIGSISRVTFTKQIINMQIPLLTDVTYPTITFKGKDDAANTYVAEFRSLSKPIIKMFNNGRISTNYANVTSGFNFGSSITLPYTRINANYTAGEDDYTIDCFTNTFTITLPNAANKSKRVYNIKNTGTGVITIVAEGGKTIDGQSTYILNQWDSIHVQSDGTNWINLNRSYRFGNSSNYTQFEADGTMKMVGTATVFDDLTGDITRTKTVGTRVVLNENENTIDFASNATLTDYLFLNYQMSHKWKFGSDIFPHIHYEQANNNIPNFLFQYRWQRQGQAKTTAWTNAKCNVNVFTYTSGTLNQIADSVSIAAPTNYGISDIIELRVIRDTANTSGLFAGADTYTGTVSLTAVDIHYEIDSVGSKEEYIK